MQTRLFKKRTEERNTSKFLSKFPEENSNLAKKVENWVLDFTLLANLPLVTPNKYTFEALSKIISIAVGFKRERKNK